MLSQRRDRGRELGRELGRERRVVEGGEMKEEIVKQALFY